MRGYEDIIGLERPASRGHPPMPREKRAAQFMPFAALTGYEEAIAETARQTEPRVTLTCFVPDPVKCGGRCVEVSGVLRRVDEVARLLILRGGERVPMDDVVAVDCVLLPDRD